MRAGGAVAGTLVVLAFVLGTTGCGDSAKKKEAAAAQARAAAHWRAGLVLWRKEMLGALNGISLLFSNKDSVQLLLAADPKTGARLDGYDATLAGCSAVISGLGPAPVELADARRSALQACASLETGARLVRAGMKDLQGGLGSDVVSRATVPLSAGQNELDVAASEARHAPSP
jgi:hypothetical protein